jgi:mRNA interferase MazF
VTAVPITTTICGIPSEVILGNDDGLPQDRANNFDPIQTVPKAKGGRLISNLSTAKKSQVSFALCFALGRDDLIKPPHKGQLKRRRLQFAKSPACPK